MSIWPRHRPEVDVQDPPLSRQTREDPGAPARRPFPTWPVAVAVLLVAGAGTVAAGAWPGSEAVPESPPRAAGVLDAAAVSARSALAPVPGSGYVFTETVSSYPEQVQQPDGSFRVLRTAPVVTQVWLPVDPARSGRQRQRPQGGNTEWGPWLTHASCRERHQPAGVDHGFPDCLRGVLPTDFPTGDPARVLAWLTGDQPVGSPSPSPSGAGSIGGREALALERAQTLLVAGTYLLPEQRSSLFRALATLPGVVTVAGAQDGAGRPGTGISAGGSEALVFDPTSFAFLGTTSSAVLRQGTTSEVGQFPS